MGRQVSVQDGAIDYVLLPKPDYSFRLEARLEYSIADILRIVLDSSTVTTPPERDAVARTFGGLSIPFPRLAAFWALEFSIGPFSFRQISQEVRLTPSRALTPAPTIKFRNSFGA